MNSENIKTTETSKILRVSMSRIAINNIGNIYLLKKYLMDILVCFKHKFYRRSGRIFNDLT